MVERQLTRRELLRRSIGTGAALMLGGPLWTGCGGLVPPPLGLSTTSALGQPTTEPALVATSRGRDLYAMTREALQRIGGIETVVQPGESVFIKPNFLTAGLRRTDHTLTGEITKPEIAIAAAEECLRVGAREVIIGDGAEVERFDWEELRTIDGTTHIAAEVARLNAAYDNRVKLACLNSDSPDWDPVPAPRSRLGEIYVSSLVSRADRIISIPVIKTHRLARLTFSLKNFMGVPPISRYGGGSESVGRFRLHWTIGGPMTSFLDIVDGLRPDLAIIDGSICCEGHGPWVRPGEGKTVDMRDRLGDWLVLASTDLVAADATASRIVGQDPFSIPYLASAYNDGLGQMQEQQIEIAGATLADLRVEWEPIHGSAPPPPNSMAVAAAFTRGPAGR